MISAPARRVVITGMGLISPLGNSPQSLWDALAAGRSGVRPLPGTNGIRLPATFAAPAHEFTGHIDDFGPLDGERKKAIRKGLKLMSRESQMAVAAAQRAIDDAGLAAGGFDPERVGAVFGSDYMLTEPEDFLAGIRQCLSDGRKFEFSRWATDGMPQVTPLWLLKYLPNMPASHVAIYNDLRGPNNSLTLREASSNLAIGEAYRTILRNSADMMLAGATGTRIHPSKIVHAAMQEELASASAEPAAASRPFDRDRTGMVLGEGAGVIVLEELSSARARGATIHAEVIGEASSSVLDRNFVARRGVALANAMRAALRSARLSAGDVGHIHAHGLSTRSGDAEEATAIREVFGSDADRVPVTAAKSYFGNLGAGSGIIELIASTMALRAGRLFPILNFRTPDAACPVAAAAADQAAGGSFMNLNFTPQGQASVVIVRRWE